MATALARAAADAGRPQLLAEAQFVGCIPPMAWSYDDLPGRVAELAGAAPREKLEPPGGGEGPILLLDDLANRIADGELEIALLADAECVYSRRRARAENRKLDWTPGGDGFPRFLASMPASRTRSRCATACASPSTCIRCTRWRARAKAGRSTDAPALRVS
jgi:acetyl-CoA C-acetyltransferase